MSIIPTISEQDIRNFVGEQSFPLGQQYFRGKTIFNVQRQGMTLKARCQGSLPEAYHVQVIFDATRITEATCSCPIGGHCKHVAALLLTWLHHPAEFIEQEEVDTVLDRLSNVELKALVKKMLQREPDLELLLPTSGKQSKQHTPITSELYRRQVEAAFRRGGHSWGAEGRIADELLTIMDTADEFVEQKDYTSAISIYEVIVTGVAEHHDEYENESGELHDVIHDCIDELDKCLAVVQDDKAIREKIMWVLFTIFRFDEEFGGIGISDEIPELVVKRATDGERLTIVGWIRDALSKVEDKEERSWSRRWYGDFLLKLEADKLDDEAYLRICRETGHISEVVERLLALGRVDEAVREIKQLNSYTLASIADIFVHYGYDTVIEQMIRERERTTRTRDRYLQEWLKKHYTARNNQTALLEITRVEQTDALENARSMFRFQPTLESYQKVRQLARQLDRWETTRQELLAQLKQPQQTGLLIHIALDEGEIDRALELVKAEQQGDYKYVYGYHSNSIVLQVAKAAEEPRPHASIEIYQKHVEWLIAQRERKTYQAACSYLSKIHILYEKLGELIAWTSYFADLRQRTQNLRAFKEEMAAAKLFS